MIPREFPIFFTLFLLPLIAQAQSPPDSIGTIHVKKKRSSSNDNLKEEVYIIVQEMPSFPPGGITMSQFIDAAFVVPQRAIDMGISGTVVISCLVNSDGELKDIKVGRGVPNCPDCNAEAVRVVSQMPLWIPGRHNGRAVPVMVSIPVKFRFNR
jgi:periplasmic protein TonB